MYWPILATVAAYLMGSLSFAVIVSRSMGLADPRSYGSGNPGATNVLRSGSKKAAIATLLLDAGKGWLAVVLVQWFGHAWGLGTGTVALVGLAAFVGHLYPVFFRFKGGKGVATAAGVLLGLEPLLGLAVLLTWGLVVALTRYVSLASIAAGMLAPTWYLIGADSLWVMRPLVLMSIIAMSMLLTWRHRDNIRRLLAGSESRLGSKKR